MPRGPADEIHRRLVARVRSEAKTRGVQLSHVPDLAGVTRSHFWDVLAGRKSPTLSWLTKVAAALGCEPWDLLLGSGPGVPPSVPPTQVVPLVNLRVAAGGFTESEGVEPAGWVAVPPERPVKPGMFAVTVKGKSMEPLIGNGDICLFRLLEGRDPGGKVVLLQLRDAKDPETGGRYTVKRFRVASRRAGRVRQVRLEPENPEFQAMVLEEDPMSQLTPIAEFLEVLIPAPN